MKYCRTYGGMEKTRKIANITEDMMRPQKRSRQRQALLLTTIFIHKHFFL